MDRPLHGILILALLAAVSLAGALYGWQLRPGAAADAERPVPPSGFALSAGGSIRLSGDPRVCPAPI